jgi:L-threonylcarbamoyladenylate synthase
LLTERIHTPQDAARIIRDGGLVAFPTETVFGLGVDATNTDAVKKLFTAKGRPSNNPLIVHINDQQDWTLAASEMTRHADALLTAFAPGPITVVLPKLAKISHLVSAGLNTVGLRIPSHPIAREIFRLAKVPVAAPSANRSGKPSSTTWQSAFEDLNGRVDAVYCEDSTSIGIESTVVHCCGPFPVILRPGAITLEQVQQIVPEAKEMASCVAHDEPSATDAVSSPGILHPHYQPDAEIHLLEKPTSELITPNAGSAYCGLDRFEGIEQLPLSNTFETVEDYAAGFYEFLRQADRNSISRIFVQTAPAHGIGRALLDRQRRAAGG